MSEDRNNIVIVASHIDDECIGCFNVLTNQKSIHIIYGETLDVIRKNEALALKAEFINVKSQHFSSQSIPPIFLNPKTTFYFPDPYFEVHPKHRMWGAIGESLLRNGLDVIFYSVNMQAPYIFEVEHWLKKKEALDKIYPSQKDLWSGGNGQYYLMEGYCKWVLKM
jgi:hypothetical protein